MNTFSQVWVFSDTPSRLPELMNGAQALANQINTFVLNDADGAQAIQLGANHVWKLSGKPDDRMIEDYADVMADTIRQHGADGLVLLPNTRRGKLLAAKLGYRLNAAVSNDASAVSVQDGKATVKHMVYGGLAIGEERIATPYAVLTISSGTFDVAQPDASRTGETHTVEWQAPAVAITRTATQARQSNSVDLDKARLVVSVGRGIGSKENIALAEQLCKAIGAELACSRPVAENEKWMEHERYVGISNLMLKPELYLAVGISGQIQHMVGANASQTIFAINKDKNAPIFQFADYGIVGDAVKILPALTAALARCNPLWQGCILALPLTGALMSEDIFDAIIVGAGLAGSVATLVLAREGAQVLVIERGNSAGAKNVTGGRLYAHSLEHIIPGFADSAPR